MTIGCYDRFCACNVKEPEPCEVCEGGYIYEPWMSECCYAPPDGEITPDGSLPLLYATGRCSKCGDGSEFARDRRYCKCQG